MSLRFECCASTTLSRMVKSGVFLFVLIIFTLLFQASAPARYWVEGIDIVTYLLNRLPHKDHQRLLLPRCLVRYSPSYKHLRIFGCACYPNLSDVAPDKLARRSTNCLPWILF